MIFIELHSVIMYVVLTHRVYWYNNMYYSRFFNQGCGGHRQAHALFLKIEPVRIVSMRVCVFMPEAINS